MPRKCTPLCPHFKCHKEALTYITKRGRKVAWCNWVGDYCKGYRCNFAYCVSHAMLPDGTCAHTVISSRRRRTASIEEEAEKMESEYVKLKGMLKKLGRDVELLE